MGPTAGLDDLKKKRVSCPCRDSNPGSSSPWPSHCTNHAIVSVSSAAMQDYGPNTDCVRLYRQTMQTLSILHVTLTVKVSPYMPSRQWRAVEILLYPYSSRRQKGGGGSQRSSREREPIPIALYRGMGLEGSEKSRPSSGFQTPDHPVAIPTTLSRPPVLHVADLLYSWQIILLHNTHTHTHNVIMSLIKTLSFRQI